MASTAQTRILRWVTCSLELSWDAGRYRHLTAAKADGWVDTLCGTTGTPGSFRGDRRKPKCPACIKVTKSPSTIHIAIGNSDDQLTQLRWSLYITSVEEIVRHYAHMIHGRWFSAPDSQFQNACWAVVVKKKASFRQELAMVAEEFGQDSIAWNESVTQMVGPEEPVSKPS